MRNLVHVLLFLVSISKAFVVNDIGIHKPCFVGNRDDAATIFFSNTRTQLSAYEVTAEPEGGEEVQAVTAMPGSRVKNMGKDEELTSDDGNPVYKFWLTAAADGSIIKKLRTDVAKEAAKKANFPGFRKGQVPPYAQPQLTMFAVQEGIIKTCEAAVAAYGLQSLKGSDGSVEVNEDVKEICKGYNVGDDVLFTGAFSATIKEIAATPSSTTDGVDESISEEKTDVSVE